MSMCIFTNNNFDKKLKTKANELDIQIPISLRKTILSTLDDLPKRKVNNTNK